SSSSLRLPLLSFLLMIRPPPSSPLFPYTTLFRSVRHQLGLVGGQAGAWSGERGQARAQRRDRALELVRQRRQDRRLQTVRSLQRSEEHTSELQSLTNLVCRLLLEKKKAHNMRKHA